MEDDSERCLGLIQKLFQAKKITNEQRDTLKDMLFDDDATLLSFFRLHAAPEEEEELNTRVIKYVQLGQG